MISLRQEATIAERLKIVQYAELKSVTAAARQFGCSRTTVYKLQKRLREEGLLALGNRPRGPREPIPEEVAELVVALKSSALHRSSTKVQQLLEERYGIRLSRQSIWRLLSARGLARIIDPTPLIRFARPLPNQLWQMDLKEKVKFPFGTAHLLVAIDDATRYCVGGRWIQDKREPTLLGAVATILEQAGLPEAILTDRETVFFGPASRQRGLTTYQLGLETLGVKPSFAKPYKPRTKGKVERFIGLVERDFIFEIQDQVSSLPALQAAWEQWRAWYNQRRPHSSLGDLPPASRYTSCQRPAPADLRALLAVEESRLVHRDATIQLAGRRFEVPPELMGKHVWVRRLGREVAIEHGGRIVTTFTL